MSSNMVQKFRTKDQKHAFDDERRRETLKKRLKEKQSRKDLIKSALSESTSANNRKIVFDDEIDEGNSNDDSHSFNNHKESHGRTCLFDESDNDEEENYEIKIKDQFEGKKGQKLLNLQSNYNNDDRFRLDERFHDDDDDNEGSEEEEDNNRNENFNSESNEIEEEKAKQLKVLENVLGETIQSKKEKKQKKSYFEMVRFDATNEDHKREDVDVEEEPVKKKKKLDKEERKRMRKEEAEKEGRKSPPKTKEKFYEVSDNLKVALKNRQNEKSQFSLLEAFSRKVDDDSDVEEEVDEAEDVMNEMWGKGGDDYVQEEKVSNYVKDSKEESAGVTKVQGITKEKFFLVDGDPRIEEALKFINMKNSDEAKEAMEKYDEKRREIREVLRLRWQKHRQRKNPFRKKIGGSIGQKPPFNKNRNQYRKTFNRRK